MEFTRSNIKEYLNNGFVGTEYYKKARNTNTLLALKEMSIDDLDFIGVFVNLFEQIKSDYKSFVSDASWKPSDRQKHLLEVINNLIVDILYNEQIKTKQPNLYLFFYDDLYWQVYDYFDDYGNKHEQICSEEIDLIMPLLEKILQNYKNS